MQVTVDRIRSSSLTQLNGAIQIAREKYKPIPEARTILNEQLSITNAIHVMDNQTAFLRNYWYVGAYSEEVERKPLARRFLGMPVVMYRTLDGKVAALEDRCIHRRASLSAGKIVGNNIQCGYHGLEMNAAGQCVKIPNQTAIPASAKVRAYVAEERDGFVWLWMGDGDGREKLEQIPDFSRFMRAGLTRRAITTTTKGSFVWGVENAMDSSHIAYVHSKAFTDDIVTGFEVKQWVEGDSLVYRREIFDIKLPPLYSQVMGFEGNADRVQEIRFVAPDMIILHATVAPAGNTDPALVRNLYINALGTPETVRSEWQFVQIHRDFQTENQQLDEYFNQGLLDALEEDRVIIEQQQKNWDEDGPDAPLVNIKVDGAGLGVRKIIARLYREQNGMDIPMPWHHLHRI